MSGDVDERGHGGRRRASSSSFSPKEREQHRARRAMVRCLAECVASDQWIAAGDDGSGGGGGSGSGNDTGTGAVTGTGTGTGTVPSCLTRSSGGDFEGAVCRSCMRGAGNSVDRVLMLCGDGDYSKRTKKTEKNKKKNEDSTGEDDSDGEDGSDDDEEDEDEDDGVCRNLYHPRCLEFDDRNYRADDGLWYARGVHARAGGLSEGL